MPITLTTGSDNSNDITLNSLTDLQNNALTEFRLADSIIANLGQPVSTFPSSNNPVTVNYKSGNNSWKLGNFTFGLSGGVCGSIAVLKPGDQLLAYTKTFPTLIGSGLDTESSASQTGSFTVPNGQCYVKIELDLTFTASAGANVQIGSVGIQGSAGTSDTFTVAFYKNVDANSILKTALAEAFEGLVLPLHSQTYTHLQAGDYLYHQFNATLNLGFGANLGLDKVFFSGQYKADIPNRPDSPAINTSIKAEVKAGLSFGATFKYTGSFEAMLWKPDTSHGRLHVYRSQTTDANFTFGSTVSVIADPTANLSAGDLATLTNNVLPGATGAVANTLMSGTNQDQVNNWVTEANNKVTSWLKPFQQGQASLQVAIDNTRSTFLLMDITLDLMNLNFQAAWYRAIAGDFNAALATGAVSLDPGSGLENFHKQTTSVTFNLFGLFKSEWDASKIENYSVTYVGNNTFNLVEKIGDRVSSTINGRGRQIDLYFGAQATSGPTGLSLDTINLYIQIKSIANPRFAQVISSFWSRATTGSDAGLINGQLIAAAQLAQATETLTIVFGPTSYGALDASTLNGGRPIINEQADINNFNAFALASSQFESSPPANFSIITALDLTYQVWRDWNIIANTGSLSPSSVPSRINIGNPAAAATFLNQQFDSPISASLISFTLDAVRRFMNFCADMKALAKLSESSSESWNDLVGELAFIVNNDIPSDFLLPSANALVNLMNQAGAQPAMSGPATVTPSQSTISVSLVYS